MRSFFEEHQPLNFSETEDELVFINARVQMTKEFASLLLKEKNAQVNFICNGVVAATKINLSFLSSAKGKGAKKKNTLQQWNKMEEKEVNVNFHSYPWDIIHFNHQAIEEDFEMMKKVKPKKITGVHFVNPSHISIGKNCNIKPGVVFDAENGPIVIGNNVTIMPNAVLVGPLFIGDNCLIKAGAKIYGGTSIGEWCKIGGEVEASIIQSHSNKQHDGYVGHSYLASWVNLGADTNTSDLKNNYRTIRVRIRNKEIDTQQLFLGAVIGDHSKTGINVMLNTGTIVGAFANIFGADFPPKFVENFSWGGGTSFERYRLQQAVETARIVMKRRNVEMTQEYEHRIREMYSSSHA